MLHLDKLQHEIDNDPHLRVILNTLQQGGTSKPGYHLVQNRLCYKNRLVLPHTSSFILLLLHEFHGSPIGGHSGFLKTYRRLATELYWEGIKTFIQDYVVACATC